MSVRNKNNRAYKCFDKLYPEERSVYTFKTGCVAEKLIAEVLEDMGIAVIPHSVYVNGADIQAEDFDIGIEVWNWSKPHEYSSRTQSVLENLSQFGYRFLIASYISNTALNQIVSYYGNTVKVIELGFQILPREYKAFYRGRKDVVYYPSKTAYQKVLSALMPLIEYIKQIQKIENANPRIENVLSKYCPLYESEHFEIWDATGLSKEEWNELQREIESLPKRNWKPNAVLEVVPEPIEEETNNEAISGKGDKIAYVYNNHKLSI